MTDLPLPSLAPLPPPPDLAPSAGAPVLDPVAAASGGVRAVVRRPWQQGRVVATWDETPTVRTFRLQLPDWVAHVPGQHYVVRLTAPDGYRAQRSYSVASPPEQTGTIDLAIERLPDGEVSGFLHDAVGVGDELEVRGPLGGWFVWDGASPALAVGGGTGVVPFMAMLRSRGAREIEVPFHLIASARSPQDLPYAAELLSARDRGEDVTVVFTRSVPERWRRPAGRLTAPELAEAVAATDVGPGGAGTTYVCGSTRFAGAAERLLATAGADPSRMRVERFGEA